MLESVRATTKSCALRGKTYFTIAERPTNGLTVKEQAMTRKSQFRSLFVLLGLLTIGAQSGFAQADPPPLSFVNNYFVTGDYVVGGASGMNSSFVNINGNSYALGTITIPDANPAIHGKTSVPNGAQVVAALLYWQTVEKVAQPG